MYGNREENIGGYEDKLPFELRPLLLEEEEFFGAHKLFEALGDEMRLEMMELMCAGEMAFGELVRGFVRAP